MYKKCRCSVVLRRRAEKVMGCGGKLRGEREESRRIDAGGSRPNPFLMWPTQLRLQLQRNSADYNKLG